MASKSSTPQQPIKTKLTEQLKVVKNSRKSKRNDNVLERLRTIVENCEKIKRKRNELADTSKCDQNYGIVMDLSCSHSKVIESNKIDRHIVVYDSEYRLKLCNPFRSQDVPSYVPLKVTWTNIAEVESLTPNVVECPAVVKPTVETILKNEIESEKLSEFGYSQREKCSTIVRKCCPIKIDKCVIKRSSKTRTVNCVLKSMRHSPGRIAFMVYSILLSVSLLLLCLNEPTVYCLIDKNDDRESNGSIMDYLLKFFQMSLVGG